MEKSISQLFAERNIPISLILEINKQNQEIYKGRNMYKSLKSIENFPELVGNINLEKNIIIASRENEILIRQNIDGTFSLILNRDENVSAGKSAMGGNMSLFDYYPLIKMCIPQGVKIHIDDPSFGFSFFDKIYPDCKIMYPDNIEKDYKDTVFSDPSLPPRYYLTDFKFSFQVDVHRLKSINKTFLLKKGQSVANIFFNVLPHIKDFGKELEGIYYIQDDEIYRTFTDTF
jgi:hypothetical protein